MTARVVETDCEFLLRILSDRQPHSLNEILQRSFVERGCGLTVHSRAANLRADGHDVVNSKTGRRGDGSWYRLVSLRESSAAVVGRSCADDSLSGPSIEGPDALPVNGDKAAGAAQLSLLVAA